MDLAITLSIGVAYAVFILFHVWLRATKGPAKHTTIPRRK